jgi:ATP dependent DNA ligase domain
MRSLLNFLARPEAITLIAADPDDTVIDGEIVAYGADGRPSFNALQNHRGAGPELHRYAFDLLTLRGKDLMRESLDERREILRAELMPLLPDSIRYSETLEASPAELIDAVREQGFEGIVAKRRSSLLCVSPPRLLTATVEACATFLFPIWMLLVSAHILLAEFRRGARTVKSSGEEAGPKLSDYSCGTR